MRQKPDAASVYREWLRRLPTLTGKSHTAMAGEINVAVSTLTRPLKADDPGTSTPNQRTIDKIVARYGVAPPDFGVPLRGPLRGFSEDAAPYEAAGSDPLAGALRALIAGRPGADAWVIKTRAIELLGYLPGDVVIVDPDQVAQPGDAVCAQINIDFRRGTAETVMRVYERAGASHVLLAASLDPVFRAPIAVDDRVAIKGVIIGMVRPLSNAA